MTFWDIRIGMSRAEIVWSAPYDSLSRPVAELAGHSRLSIDPTFKFAPAKAKNCHHYLQVYSLEGNATYRLRICKASFASFESDVGSA